MLNVAAVDQPMALGAHGVLGGRPVACSCCARGLRASGHVQSVAAEVGKSVDEVACSKAQVSWLRCCVLLRCQQQMLLKQLYCARNCVTTCWILETIVCS
jgi:hypothetical protein